MEEKVYELMEKVYAEMQRGFKQVDEKLDKKADKTDIAKLENDHGTKLDALFDGYKFIFETLEGHTECLRRMEDKLDSHDAKIHALQRKNG